MLKILSVKELVLSHVFLVGGLVLLSFGLALDIIGLTIAGIWVFALGLCAGFGLVFGKLMTK